MQGQPFGQTFNFRLSLSRLWLSLGPGWAVIAGALSSDFPGLTLITVLQLIAIWVLVDPLLGTLWSLAVQQGLWRRLTQAKLPPPPRHGFSLPYAQPSSLGGRFVIALRRYQVWWRDSYWPVVGGDVVTFALATLLAGIIALLLNASVFWLTVLTICLTLLAGHTDSDLSASSGGRWPSLVQLLLPWLMGVALWNGLSLLTVMMGVCFWIVYLGALRLLGRHQRAAWLFWGGQVAALLLLLGLRSLPSVAMLSALLITQRRLQLQFPDIWLKKAQPYLVLAMLIAGWSLGRLA